MSAKILIVEDEAIVAMEIESYLRKLGYEVIDTCTTADDAYIKAIESDVDMILMDIYLMEGDGVEASIRIKKQKDIPIIFLTAHIDKATIERAIEVDPTAYLMKPFNRQELFAAVKIGLKSYSKKDRPIGDIVLDYEFSFNRKKLQLLCCGEEVHLTKKERELLIFFLNNKNQLISFMTMEYELWPDKPSSANRRRTLISRLRSKLKHRFIDTYSSEGYIFKVDI